MQLCLCRIAPGLIVAACMFSRVADSVNAASNQDADPGCYAAVRWGEVAPTPREAAYADEWVVLLEPKQSAAAACIVAAPEAPTAVRLAAEELSNRCALLVRRAQGVESGAVRGLPIVPDLAASARFRTAIIVCVGGDGFGIALPGRVRAEGYRIAYRRAGSQLRVVCAGRDARGAYYGAQSLQQLCGVRNGAVVLRLAEITDWPAYRIRCTGNDGSIPAGPGVCERAVTWLPRFKFNAWAVGESYIWPNDWRAIPKESLEALERACRLAKQNGTIDVIFQIHPFRGRPQDQQYNMTISDPRDVDVFVGLCDRMLAAGARGILFRADDYHPLSPPDKARFGGKAEAHVYLIRELHRRLKAKYPDYYLIFCPPYYQGQTARSRPEYVEYMRKLGKEVPQDVYIMWTGPITRSLEISKQDVADYKALIARDPFLWDNTVYAHRSRFGYDPRRPGYLFDPFETRYPADYPETCPGIRYNWGYRDGAISKVGNVTIADYLWNPAGYDPEHSLRRALATVYTPAAAEDLIAFRNAYYTIKDAVEAGRSAEAEVYAAVVKAARSLPAILARLSKAGLSADQIAELRRRSNSVLRMFQQLDVPMRKAQAIRRDALVRFHFDDGTWRSQSRGKWTVETTRDSVRFSFPFHTPSVAGAFGGISGAVPAPASPTGKYYLAFSVFDDYGSSGTPPSAWPGYLRKQVLVGGKVVWDDDVEGAEPPMQELLQIVDITRYVQPGKPLPVTFRGFDLRGVHNMGAKIRFAGACILAGPAVVRSMCVEVPDCTGIRPPEAFSILLRFTPRSIGKRQPLYAKNPAYQYFGYQHQSGRVVAGVFAGKTEISVQSKQKVVPGQVNTLAFVFDHGTLRLFLNGVQENTARSGAVVRTSSGPLRIGAYRADGPYYDGVIHEFKLFRRAVAPEALEKDSGDVGRSAEDLGGWWRLDDPNMPVARDLAGICPDGAVYRVWDVATQR